MGIGANLNAMNFGLERLIDEIKRAATLENGRTEKGMDFEASAQAFAAQMGAYKRRLDAIRGGLKRAEQQTQGMAHGAHLMRRGGAKYRAQQTVKTHSHHHGQVVEKATEAAVELKALILRGGRPTMADIAKGLDGLGHEADALLQAAQQTGDAYIVVQANGAINDFQGLKQAGGDFSASPITLVLTFVSLFVAILEKRKQKRALRRMS
jgi:hypothetical protein